MFDSAAMAQAPIVLDGGLATELESRGHDLSDDLWSARLLIEAPEEIVAAHRAFFAAGSQVATAASYQASFDGFARHGVDRVEAVTLLRRSIALAQQARDAIRPDGWVAASIGPYGAVLADGSEYRGRYGLTPTELRDFHRPRLEALAAAEPDIFAVETIPDVDEAEVLIDLIETMGLPAWLSYSVAGEVTRAGQPLTEAYALASGRRNLVAVGVNCSAPRDIAAAVVEACRQTGLPVVAYPNSGETWDAGQRAWRGESCFDVRQVQGWLDHGVALVGGCCRVGPADIAALAATVGISAEGPQ